LSGIEQASLLAATDDSCTSLPPSSTHSMSYSCSFFSKSYSKTSGMNHSSAKHVSWRCEQPQGVNTDNSESALPLTRPGGRIRGGGECPFTDQKDLRSEHSESLTCKQRAAAVSLTRGNQDGSFVYQNAKSSANNKIRSPPSEAYKQEAFPQSGRRGTKEPFSSPRPHGVPPAGRDRVLTIYPPNFFSAAAGEACRPKSGRIVPTSDVATQHTASAGRSLKS